MTVVWPGIGFPSPYGENYFLTQGEIIENTTKFPFPYGENYFLTGL